MISDFSKFIVLFCIASIIIGTGFFLWAFIKVGSEPSVLVGFFYGFFGTELFHTARIKINKVKSNNNEKQ